MSDEDYHISRFSASELLLWYAKFGFERLSFHQRRLLQEVLLPNVAREKAPPDRKLSPSEWAQLKADEAKEEQKQFETIFAA